MQRGHAEERRRGAAVIRVCQRCKGVWLERAVFKVLITGTERKSDDGAMSRVRQWEETFESAVQIVGISDVSQPTRFTLEHVYVVSQPPRLGLEPRT